MKGKSKKVRKFEEIIIQEGKEEIVEETHSTFKTYRLHENVNQGNKDKEKIFPIDIKLQPSEKYPAKYYEPENMDTKHTLSHGEKRSENENVKTEKTNNGKRSRKSTFTVVEFRDQENNTIEDRCRELDNPNGLHKKEKKEPVKVSTKDTPVSVMSAEIMQKSKK